jgi:hypothetical protein
VLVVAARDVRIDPPTLREAHEAERKWAGERSMGGSKRARALSARGLAAYRAKILASRIPREEAEAKWRDVEQISKPRRRAQGYARVVADDSMAHFRREREIGRHVVPPLAPASMPVWRSRAAECSMCTERRSMLASTPGGSVLVLVPV